VSAAKRVALLVLEMGHRGSGPRRMGGRKRTKPTG